MNFKPKLEKKGEDSNTKITAYAPISKFMIKDLITFSEDAEILEVIDTLLTKNISGAPVLNSKNEIVGVIDDKDCLHTFVDSAYHNAPIRRKKVGSYMTNVYKTISIHADILDAANEFIKASYKRLLVVDDHGKLKGQVTRGDVLRAVKEVSFTNWHKQE